MKKGWLIVLFVVLVLVLIGLVVKLKIFGRQGPAALQVSASPKAVVFIDGTQVGLTPFLDDNLEPGEHTVRLVPETNEDNLTAWEGKVNLSSGIMVVVSQSLAIDQTAASGEILTLEKIESRDKSSLTVISKPDQSVIKLNGEPKGFSPISVEDLAPDNYQVTVSSPGFQEKTISAKTVAGYKLVVEVKLAQQVEETEDKEGTTSAEPVVDDEEEEEPELKTTPQEGAEPSKEPEKPYVKIKQTPTGWLRVRKGPSTQEAELGKANPGDTFPYLEEVKSGWYKIEYEEQEGWVSGTYIELVE